VDAIDGNNDQGLVEGGCTGSWAFLALVTELKAMANLMQCMLGEVLAHPLLNVMTG
jgi:hypothetical protein